MVRFLLLALAICVTAVVAVWALVRVIAPDRPRVPAGAALADADTVEIAEGDYYVSFGGTSRDHRHMAYAREDGDRWEVVVADAVTARPLNKRVFESRSVALGWRGTILEVALQADRCRRAFVARPPRWRFEDVPCTPEHGRARQREEVPPAPIDLRPATQCDPSPTVKAPRRRLWAVEVCTDQGLRDPEFVFDVRVVDARGQFVAQFPELLAPQWAADGSIVAVSDDGQRLVRVPANAIK